MAKSDTLHIRVAPEVKSGVESTLGTLGMSVTEAVNIFFHQVMLTGGLHFAVKMPAPNAETIAAMREARDIASGKISAKQYHSVAELMEDLTNDADD